MSTIIEENKEYIIYHKSNAFNTPVFKLIPHFLLELQEKDLIELDSVTGNKYDDYIWLESNKKIMGFIGFAHHTTEQRIDIMSAYVLPEYRRSTGFKLEVYDCLFNRLKEYARDLGALRILSGTNVNNTAAQIAFERQGRKQVGLIYNYQL